jgi:NhaP-type Na+/H+ or K+/H+ antiporter
VFAKVSVSPNTGGLPGTDQGEKVISGVMFSALLACVAGVIIGGAVCAVSSHGGDHHYAQRGKASFLISAVAAAVIAAAPAVVNSFEGLGRGVR